VDATVKSGVKRQVEAFRSGFNQVQPHLHCFKICINVSFLDMIFIDPMILVYFDTLGV
jgi:hypothetical protein